MGVLAYFDYQCPYCAQFARETLPDIIREYVVPGHVQFIMKNFPLPMHPLARGAAVAGLCAGAQNRFWEFHDVLVQPPPRFLPDELLAVARAMGLDAEHFEQCQSNDRIGAAVDADAQEAARIGINGTPTFILGTIDSDGFMQPRSVLTGAKDSAQFRLKLDLLLKGR